ncbi:MAG: DUF3472 domain-containing protein [Bacteroidota bacterium]
MRLIANSLLTFCAVIILSVTLGYSQANLYTVPLGGNSWVTKTVPGGKEAVTDTGWINWRNPGAVFSTYVYIDKPGLLSISSNIIVPSGKSKIKCILNGKTFIKEITAKKVKYHLGDWNITKLGYQKIDLQGVSKTGNIFAVMDALTITGSAVNEQAVFVKSNDDNYFYWGRRGPSVHVNYDISEVKDDIEWFYNEITVPVGNDIVGSFFMANGFAEGYFGMQVNSTTERRILFSVWSPYTTDDPKLIPEDKRIILLKKGNDVYTGEFGNEGSGGQSYLKYNWKVGDTCKFLLRGKPSGNGHTIYTAYFFDKQVATWLLIASFSRPATQTHLKKLHSFLENFEPETGWKTRKALYGNQWVKTKAGEWKALHSMTFTADNTARKAYRVDYSGGVTGNHFFLQNDGFFKGAVKINSRFQIPVPLHTPVIDFSILE